jgi:hypothetical protein
MSRYYCNGKPRWAGNLVRESLLGLFGIGDLRVNATKIPPQKASGTPDQRTRQNYEINERLTRKKNSRMGLRRRILQELSRTKFPAHRGFRLGVIPAV